MSPRRNTKHAASPRIEPASPRSASPLLPAEDRLIEIDEVLQLVPASRHTLLRWRRAGRFPHPIVVGARRFWSTREIAVWIEQQRARRDLQHEAAAARR